MFETFNLKWAFFPNIFQKLQIVGYWNNRYHVDKHISWNLIHVWTPLFSTLRVWEKKENKEQIYSFITIWPPPQMCFLFVFGQVFFKFVISRPIPQQLPKKVIFEKWVYGYFSHYFVLTRYQIVHIKPEIMNSLLPSPKILILNITNFHTTFSCFYRGSSIYHLVVLSGHLMVFLARIWQVRCSFPTHLSL